MGNCDNNNAEDSLAKLLGPLRNSSNYPEAATLIKHQLGLKHRFGVFELKVLLLRAATECWAETKERDMVLVALGLLEGYYQDTRYVENIEASKTKTLRERREKYLQCGPYVRTKRGKRYVSFDSITDEEKNDVRNALERQDIRLVDKLAKYIEGINGVQQYVDEAVNDPDFDYAGVHTFRREKRYFIRLPKQCRFLEDFPPPKAEIYMYAAKQEAVKNKPKKAKQETVSSPVPGSTEVCQATAETSPLLSSWSHGNLSYTRAQVDGGILGDTIVFNALSDGVIGDEKKFVGVRVDTGLHNGKDNVWHPDYIDILPNYVYIIRLYVHNDNPNGLQAVARDVKAAFQVPTESGSQIRVTGLLESSNATPNWYSAKVVFRSNRIKFHLEYIPGSAKLENSGIGRRPGLKISDDIIAGGVLVSYDSLNGDIPGGFPYASYITIRVKAVADSGFRVEHRVRLVGTAEWKRDINDVKIGDRLEYRIRYTNTSSNIQRNVMIKDILPKNIRYISGSTVFINGSNILRNFGQDSLFTTGVNIGHYESGANALVDFSAEIIDNDLPNGSCTLVNWSQCCVDDVTLQDYSTVTLYKVE